MAQNSPYTPRIVPAVQIDGGTWLGTGQLAVTTKAALVVDYNPNRRGLTITNLGTVSVYISSYQSVTTATGYPILAGGTVSLDVDGPIYVVAAAAGTTIAWAEETGVF